MFWILHMRNRSQFSHSKGCNKNAVLLTFLPQGEHPNYVQQLSWWDMKNSLRPFQLFHVSHFKGNFSCSWTTMFLSWPTKRICLWYKCLKTLWGRTIWNKAIFPDQGTICTEWHSVCPTADHHIVLPCSAELKSLLLEIRESGPVAHTKWVTTHLAKYHGKLVSLKCSLLILALFYPGRTDSILTWKQTWLQGASTRR